MRVGAMPLDGAVIQNRQDMTTAARARHTSRPLERWIGLRRLPSKPRMRLIAFPYAGGGASVYRRWISDLPHHEWLDVVAVQLPGRETRSSEAPFTAIQPLLDDLEPEIKSMTDLPYVLFGYSMGALLAYELGARLACHAAPPELIIVAARKPPYRQSARRCLPSRDEIMEIVQRLGGMPGAIINNVAFDRHYLPLLQADFAVADMFGRRFPEILPCPILALGAHDDPDVPVAEIESWSAASGHEFETKFFSGGHFFLHSAHDEVISVVNSAIESAYDREAHHE